MKRLLMAAAAAALTTCAFPVAAQDNEQALEDVSLEQRAEHVMFWLAGAIDPVELFTPEFIVAVGPANLHTMREQLQGQFGAITGVEEVTPVSAYQAQIKLRFERAVGSGTMALSPEAPHRIAGLRLSSFEPVGDSVEAIMEELSDLPGEVDVWFGALEENAVPILAIEADAPLAIGSTFKLYVLAALGREISEGRMAWDDVLTLDRKSFPSGIMQDWPMGAPVTLHTAAALMISRSDNTATDLLLDHLGRERVEREVSHSGHSDPGATIPFLTTSEMFALKAGPEALVEDYRSATDEEKRAILSRIDPSQFTLEQVGAAFGGGPRAIDLEWFARAADLRALLEHMVRTADPRVFDIMAINPSLPRTIADNWAYAGYKGGSEPGVLNLTWLLRDEDDRWHMLAMSWNNSESGLDQATFELLAQRILSLAP